MAQTVNFIFCPEDRERLCAIIAGRRRPLKQLHRTNIVLLPAERLPVGFTPPRGRTARRSLAYYCAAAHKDTATPPN